jgi:hypothetical protein
MNAMMMEAVSTFETSVNIYQNAWCNIPEDSHLHIRRHENLKYTGGGYRNLNFKKISMYKVYSLDILSGIISFKFIDISVVYSMTISQ